MVLLTSSTISVAISSGIICMFTFLLFMSGYVMQQQTVRSLQHALHAPPVPKPTPTLPPQFQKSRVVDVLPVAEAAVIVTGESDPELVTVDDDRSAESGTGADNETSSNPYPAEAAAVVPGETASNLHFKSLSISEGANEDTLYIEPTTSVTSGHPKTVVASSVPPDEPLQPSSLALPLRLAYVLTVTKPSQICSALLFFRQHSHSRRNDNVSAAPTYLLLYPSRWETDPSHEAHTTALTLMRLAQDSLDIVYHPVRTTDAWSGLESASIQSQLLGELQRYYWGFDRMLYLKTPGLATDIAALDAALSSSPGSLRRNWVLLAKISSASREATDPPTMLLSEKGILVPRGELRGRLVVNAATGGHVDQLARGMDPEAASKAAAYVYFTQDELQHPREEKALYAGIFERYEQGVNEVCKGSVFDVEKGELK